MTYIDPSSVTSPQAHVANVIPIKDTGEDEWSAALFEWDGKAALGLRWNGGGQDKLHPGNPQSRGLSTWFIVPWEIAPDVLQAVINQSLGGGKVDKVKAKAACADFLFKLEATAIAAEGRGFRERVEQIVLAMKTEGKI